MLTIHTANRVESLVGALQRQLDAAPGSVFDAQPVIVPSAAIERHLTLARADHAGVCAQVEFSFLAHWLWRQIARWVPDVAAKSPFAPALLAWRIYAAFDDDAWCAAQPRLGAYLADADAAMRFELALRTARLFDQYITYRPDWLAAWADGRRAPGLPEDGAPDEAWQAALWRRVAAAVGGERQHPAWQFLDALDRHDAGGSGADVARDAAGAALPRAAHIVLLPTLPPLYLEVLQRLAQRIDLHLYMLNPSSAYWFDVVDPARLARLAVAGKATHHEVGNRLLASWGRQTQTQLGLLLEADAGGDGFVEHFVANAEVGHTSLLAQVQDAMLELVELEPGSIDLAPDDRSIEVHVCHSLLRELEVLHDRLLALFAGPNPPDVSDILVAVPDLEAAAPLIDAVFGTAPPERHIPYAITGRPRSTQNAAARALLSVLALVASRLPATAVVELLQQPMVARRFGLDDEALRRVERWVRSSGIRWGFDAEHRARLDLPPTPRHSLDDGLQRLYLGYALPDQVDAPFEARLPAGDVEGSGAAPLGGFWRCAEALRALQRATATPLDADAWLVLLTDTLAAFTAPRDPREREADASELPTTAQDAEDLRELRAALADLHGDITQAGVTAPIPLAVLHAALTRQLDDPARGGVPTGVLTFSSLASLRNVPARVVCVLNLNDGLYPGAARQPEFDLMALHPRRGDRSLRDDERQTFLDLLLAARERLHLSYTGRSARDNSAMPPSVLVAELLESVLPAVVVVADADADADADGEGEGEGDPASAPGSAAALAAARARLVVQHPLQPFAASAFDPAADPRQRSHDAEYADALQAAVAAASPDGAAGNAASDAADRSAGSGFDDDGEAIETDRAGAFFARPLDPPEAEWREVTLEQLTEFYRNPSRYLLRRRLRLDVGQPEAALSDDEPLLPDFEGRSGLADRLLPRCLAGAGRAALQALAEAGTEFPAGRLGELLLARELDNLQAFADSIRVAAAEALLPPVGAELAADLDGQTWRLRGSYAELRTSGQLRYRCDDTRPTDYLSGWLAHLLLCADPPAGVALETVWHSRDGSYRIEPVAQAEARRVLTELLRHYRAGLQAPLHFFPKSAFVYVRHAESLTKAQQKWRCTPQRPHGESADPAYRLALRGVDDPIDDEFVDVARAVFGTLFMYLDDPRLE